MVPQELGVNIGFKATKHTLILARRITFDLEKDCFIEFAQAVILVVKWSKFVRSLGCISQEELTRGLKEGLTSHIGSKRKGYRSFR